MYVEPNSTVRLCKGVPIDPDYTDTFWFKNNIDQYNYFVSKSASNLVFENVSYVRKERGVLRVQAPIANLAGCNYMMYRNTSHFNKWFYAFVTKVDYVNEQNTAVYFTIDPLQTYFFEYTNDQCMIERAHSLTDNIGDNIVPDIMNGGEYVLNDYEDLYPALSNRSIVVQWVNPSSNTGWLYDGTFGAAELLCYHDYQYQDVQDFIDSQAQHPDSIQGIYMCPTPCVRGYNSGNRLPSFTDPFRIVITKAAPTIGSSLDGYIPKNHKLYTYPYSFYHIDEPGGSSLDLRYEFFKTSVENSDVKVRISGNASFPVELTLSPVGYKGSGINNEYRSEKLTIKGFPMCSYATDAYAAWVAQNSVPMAIKVAGNVGQLIASPSGSTVSGLIGTVADVVSEGYEASIAADITKGSFSSGSNDFSADRMTFWGGKMSLNKSDAKIIDDFFTMYGYAVKQYGTPSRYRRKRFTYVKTVGANVHGDLPADDAQAIANIYNNGVRFWADTVNFGNYAMGNPLIT